MESWFRVLWHCSSRWSEWCISYIQWLEACFGLVPLDEVSVVEEGADVVVRYSCLWLDEVHALSDGLWGCLECCELELYCDVVGLVDEFWSERLVGDRGVVVLECVGDGSDEQ